MVDQDRLSQCILAFDYGEKRTGVAISRAATLTAEPLTTIDADVNLISQVKYLIGLHQPDLLVVGRPRGLDGQTTNQTRRAEAFAEKIAAQTGLETKLQDETLTTVEAERRLPRKADLKTRKALIDQIAAQIILEDFINAR